MRAIFGDKAGDVKDASLKATPSLSGVVIKKRLFSRAQKNRKSKLADKAILPRLDEEFEAQAQVLKNTLIEKLLILTENKLSAGVKDFLGTDLITKNSKFTEERLRDIDFSTVQLSKWTQDAHTNDLIRQVILNCLKNTKN